MSSPHFSASFRNSCIIAPRHPKTSLPTTVVERKSLQFDGETGYQNGEKRSNYMKKKYKHRENERIKSEKVNKTFEASRLVTFNDTKDSFVHDKNVKNVTRPFTAPQKRHENFENDKTFSLFDSRNSETLKNLINDDDQFFQHLQSLKEENQKTLKTLGRLYNQSFNGSHHQEYNNRNLETTFDSAYASRRKNRILDVHELRKAREKLNDESSDDELDEQLKVRAPENHVNILPDEEQYFRGRSSSYDVIGNMWENFSVDEYVPYTKAQKKKEKQWSPSITIPEPFQMTIREQMTAKRKSKRIEEIEEEKLQKRLLEEAEMQKRIVPTPVPPTTFLPLYQEINEHNEKKRQYVRDLRKEILKSTEKPFSFMKREEAKKEMKRSHSLNNLHLQRKKEKDEQFKANPYPEKIFNLTLADRLAEVEEYRKIKIKLRAEEMLASSSLPLNMKTRGAMRYYPMGAKTKRMKEELQKRKQKSFQPQVHHDIPDFDVLQTKFEAELEERKGINTPTICEPFDLHTAQVPTRRSKFRESVLSSKQAWERPPSGRSQCHTPNRSRSVDRPLGSSWSRTDRSPSVTRRVPSPVFSLTETSRLRQERMRQTLEKSRQENIRQSLQENMKKQRQSGLRKKVAKKALAHDPSRNREKETNEKLKSFKEADHVRKKEYKDYLNEIDSRLNERPLLFERETQTNAKRKAQRRYEEILQQAGVEGDVLQSVLNATDGYSADNTSIQDDDDENESNDDSYDVQSYDDNVVNSADDDNGANSSGNSDVQSDDENDEISDDGDDKNVDDDDDKSNSYLNNDDVENSDDGSYTHKDNSPRSYDVESDDEL